MTRLRLDWRSLALATWALSGCATDSEGAAPPANDEAEEQGVANAALNNGLAVTPPMGWNSWNKLGCNDLNETVVRQMADSLVSSGMKDAGYQYVVLDDCWQTSRNAQGKIVADATKFPSGIKALADYVHAKGLKFGLYTDAGTATCAGRPGSYGYETQDAASYAAWGVDFVKVDWCNSTGLDPETRYGVMRDAIAGSGRNMVFSICNWGVNSPWLWGPNTGHMWRTTYDIFDNWGSMLSNVSGNNYPSAAKAGAWNDPDMLEIGNGGMTDTEYRSHMSLWAVMSAPLIAGNDLRNMSAATRMTLTNPEVIAVDQDTTSQGYPVRDSGTGLQVWSKRLATAGSRAVVLLNRTSVTQTMSVSWADLGLTGNAAVRDLWARTNRGTFAGTYSAVVPPHGAAMLTLTGASEAALPQSRITVKNIDTRPVTGLRVEAEFYVDGFLHYDYEDITTFDKTITFELNGLNGSWDGSKMVGNFLTTKSAVAGDKSLTILKTDTRTVVNVKLKFTFQVNGAAHYDDQVTGDLVGHQALVLNAVGGGQQGSTWLGDFLRPWNNSDETGVSAELVWPNTSSRNNSSAWLRTNHAAIKRMEPRVLVLDVQKRVNETPLDQFLPKLVDAFAEGSRYRAYANANATPFVNYQIDKVVNLRDPGGAEYPSFWPQRTANGWNVGELFTTAFAAKLGYADPANPGQFLTMCQLFERGIVNELWISADTNRNVYENQSYLQKYDANRAPLAGQFNKCTNACFYDTPQLPVACAVSVRMQEINTTRGEGCGTHAAGHSQENLKDSIPYLADNAKRFYGFDLNTRYGLTVPSLYSCSSTNQQACFTHPSPARLTSTAAWTSGTFDITNWGQGCGNVHFPPNARYHYDDQSTVPALSSCEGYGLGANGVDATTSYSYSKVQAYDAVHGDCSGGWMMYMGQSMPGLGNLAKAVNGQPMLNWWPFLYY